MRIPTWLWLVLLSVLVVVPYVATIGASGPWDPWETHYGEVARQILVRNDPLDLWWRPGLGPDGNTENTFWSKPALPFWAMAASMAAFGVGTQPAADEMVRGWLPELALRLPSLLAGLLCAVFLGYVVYRLLRPQGPAQPGQISDATRAAVCTSLVLVTMPQWAIVTRQALTDMFFVAPVVVAMGAWLLAWSQPDRALRRRSLGELLRWPAPASGGGLVARVRRWTVPWDRAYVVFMVGALVTVVLPLTILHMHVISDETVARVARFAKRPDIPSIATLRQIHLHLLGYWVVAGVALVLSLRWTQRSQVWMGVLYIAAGLSLLGKGMIGPGLVGLLVLADMAISGRFGLLRRCGLGCGILLFVITALPWHHAMALYRGERWINELIIVNNLARFGSGEQDQAVGSFAFYLRTLGLAALPWSAVIPAAVWSAARRLRGGNEVAPDAQADALAGIQEVSPSQQQTALRRFALLWAVVTLALLSYSVTKYYHYLLPALPPFAVLVGLWLAERRDQHREGRRTGWVMAVAGLLVLGLVLRDWIVEPAWLVHLTTYLYTQMWRDGAPEVMPAVWCLLPFVAGLGLWAARRTKLAVVAMGSAALLLLGWTLGRYLPAASEHWSQRTAMRTYYDQRGPDDPLLSWWFYYRGETYFTKAQVLVIKDADRGKLEVLVDELRGSGRTLWVMTTVGHSKRLKGTLPIDLRPGLRFVYENAHYVLAAVPVP